MNDLGTLAAKTASMALALHLGILAPQLSFARGADSSGGGDVFQAEIAWFQNPKRVVTYCLQISEGFGATSDSIEEAIHFATTEWKNYIEQKEIHTSKINGLATEFAKVTACERAELQFLFGVTSPEVNEDRSK